MPQQSLITMLVMWAVIIGIFWLFIIKPQKKKDNNLKDMRNNLSVGDKVVTIGGIKATVARVEEEHVVLELGPSRTKVPFERWAIGSVEAKSDKPERAKAEVKEIKEDKKEEVKEEKTVELEKTTEDNSNSDNE
ncbi:MAG: preprotein translocase subunit YajC [Clostridioides sp.]|jgi:preprotein translocase subunit YajC|nr:preprotein translocase subunit YajC [Clostridioides sp.]